MPTERSAIDEAHTAASEILDESPTPCPPKPVRGLYSPFGTKWSAIFAAAGIIVHLILRFTIPSQALAVNLPLFLVLVFAGLPPIYELLRKALKREFGSDLLAGISIVTSVLLGEYLVGSIIVLMLVGGAALEDLASRRASSVLDALARRIPQVAHRKIGEREVDIALQDISIGDLLIIHPHEIVPADGVVVTGHGEMNEAYLTGEPFETSKTLGSLVLSGAINGDDMFVIRAEKKAADSRYASIMRVMEETQQRRPRLRRIGDQLGAWYTPVAVGIAILAALLAGNWHRFLAVLVIATPCPLLLAIPVAIIGGISLAARRGIIVKNPAVLEQLDSCRTFVFDKTGTLTYGLPLLEGITCAPGFDKDEVLGAAASVERYSKHPLARAILQAAEAAHLQLRLPAEIHEPPGEGLRGVVDGEMIWITGRSKLQNGISGLPSPTGGLECVMLVDGKFAAVFRFHDTPRKESRSFLDHLKPKHRAKKVVLVSGDRGSEVEYLAAQMGITEVYASKSPEEKVDIVRAEAALDKTLFVGDGINDAPAMQAATIGVAFGIGNDITSEAGDAVVLEPSLRKVDELIHIGRRMRTIALQSVLGGMGLSIIGMLVAAAGYLPPIDGAIAQEIIDLAAVLNAVRTALPRRSLADF